MISGSKELTRITPSLSQNDSGHCFSLWQCTTEFLLECRICMVLFHVLSLELRFQMMNKDLICCDYVQQRSHIISIIIA
jgi:hypothetical protein